MLFLLIFLPMFGGVMCWIASNFISRQSQCLAIKPRSRETAKGKPQTWRTLLKHHWLQSGTAWIAIFTLVLILLILVYYWQQCLGAFYGKHSLWSVSLDVAWIPFLGIRFHLLLDGLALLFALLSVCIALFTVLYSYKERIQNYGLFYFFILWCTSAAIGLFTAADLFLFFLFWEMVTIPIYFLIVLWGRRDSNSQLRFNGAVRLVIFTQLSGLLMLISIISLALINFTLSGHWTFDYAVLVNTPISYYVEFISMLGFLIAFVVRVPLVPFHGGFIDAHIESSTTSSMVISGFLTNTALYGILRFVIPIFPNASVTLAPFVIVWALIAMYYASLLIFDQSDIKKLIAYVHIALMNFMLAMVYMGDVLSYQGIIIQSIANSILIIGLFMLSGLLTARYQTRNINQFVRLGGVVTYLPAFTLFFVLTTLGVPGTANFIGNLMLLFGGFEPYPVLSILLIGGLLLASIAMLIRMQPIFYGVLPSKDANFDVVCKALSKQDLSLLIVLVVILFIIGIFPQFILDTTYPIIEKVAHYWKNSQVIAFREGV